MRMPVVRSTFLVLLLALAGALVACSPAASTPAATPRPRAFETPSPPATPQGQAPDDDTIATTLLAAGIMPTQWRTDFTKRSVPLEEIVSGGPRKDGIPAIDNPKFVPVAEASSWLAPREPVLALELNGDVRAYPVQVLIWHEIVNDVVGGRPVAVTYCPLCNTAIVFDAALPDGRQVTFGTTGNLRFSDLVMYDRQTESWWQQITGEAIVGELVGSRLRFIPASMVSWDEFMKAHPDGKVLSKATGYPLPYGENPYLGYDTRQPFLYQGPEDNRLTAIERVVTVAVGEEAVAFPFSVLEKEPVVHYTLGEQSFVVFYRMGTTSALDTTDIAQGRDVGATGVFVPRADGRTLTFRAHGEEIVDNETDSTWNLLGEAVSGPLKGQRLEPVLHANHFWFSWAVFKPHTKVYRGQE
ncbi:MAG: DUF3179 domain-containing protein [Chloroflexi bacterium]|nr:DUF3179 domain-containing protein [Chloroflexota bacterium]